MFSTDIPTENQKTPTELDDFSCGIIVGRYEGGQSIDKIQRDMNIDRNAIVECIKRFEETGSGALDKSNRTEKNPKRNR